MRGRTRAASAAFALGIVVSTVVASLTPAASATDSTQPFSASYEGTFLIRFGTGPLGSDELFFSGTGRGNQVGTSAIDGYSTLRDSGPGCKRIETDAVTVTAADGSELFFENSGEDCIDLSQLPRIVIRGTASYMVVGGQDRFEGASGSGSVTVTAEVTQIFVGSVSGTFDPLVFGGNLSS